MATSGGDVELEISPSAKIADDLVNELGEAIVASESLEAQARQQMKIKLAAKRAARLTQRNTQRRLSQLQSYVASRHQMADAPAQVGLTESFRGSTDPNADVLDRLDASSFCVTIKYRQLAWIMCISFYATVVIGFFITIFATPFSTDSDVVLRVFPGYSPCVFFDHYPSNVVTMIGMTFMCFGSGAMLMWCVCHTLLTHPNIFNVGFIFLAGGPIMIMYLGFVNIFAVILSFSHSLHP